MASFTGVGDSVSLQMTAPGDTVDIDISGTYNMTILLQREVGSPGSGAWETLRTYDTANATVAEKYETEKHNEKLQLIVTIDTSGTATATLADNTIESHDEVTIRDPEGNALASFDEGGVAFLAGIKGGAPVTITAATTLTVAEHKGRTIVFNDADGATVTLPTATGSGVKFRFFVGVTVTSNADVIQVAGAADVIQGAIIVVTDTSGITVPTAATSDTITMNGTTTGGILGSWLELEDVASGVWSVRGALVSSGAEATPFSAAVS